METVVRPLLKKPSLDLEEPNNFKPVLNALSGQGSQLSPANKELEPPALVFPKALMLISDRHIRQTTGYKVQQEPKRFGYMAEQKLRQWSNKHHTRCTFLLKRGTWEAYL